MTAPQMRIELTILKVIADVVYKLYFHPLAKYPGPFLAKITNLYSAYHSWKGDIPIDQWRCHQKYGDKVRYAPNKVMFNSASSLKGLFQPLVKCLSRISANRLP